MTSWKDGHSADYFYFTTFSPLTFFCHVCLCQTVCVCGFDQPRCSEAAGENTVSDTEPDSGKHQRPPQTKPQPENKHKTHTEDNKWFTNPVTPPCVFCVGQFVWSACCATIQQRKETMLTAETKLPSCVYKTNKPWIYLNKRLGEECECSTGQTTATIVCQAVRSSLIIYLSNKQLSCLFVGPSFKSLAASHRLSVWVTSVSVCSRPVNHSALPVVNVNAIVRYKHWRIFKKDKLF